MLNRVILKKVIKDANEPLPAREIWKRSRKYNQRMKWSTVKRLLKKIVRKSKFCREKKAPEGRERKIYHYWKEK